MTKVNYLENPSNESRQTAKKISCFSGKLSFITDLSPPNVHLLYQMTVRNVKCSFRKFPLMKTQINLTNDFVLHEQSL